MVSANVPVGALNADQVRQVLAAAEKAPAVHHVRPWRFHCTKTAFELLLDLRADTCGQGNDHREAWVACGAALLNLRLAIRSWGVVPIVHLLPKMDHPSLLASVEIDGRRLITKDGLELALAIELQETGTGHLQNDLLPDALIVQLRHAARIEQAWIALLPASALLLLHEVRGESGPRGLLDPAPNLVVVGTLQDDPTSRLRAGQAIQRVLLTATRSDLSACFIAMSADMRTGRIQLRELIGGGLWPQALLQIGRLAA